MSQLHEAANKMKGRTMIVFIMSDFYFSADVIEQLLCELPDGKANFGGESMTKIYTLSHDFQLDMKYHGNKTLYENTTKLTVSEDEVIMSVAGGDEVYRHGSNMLSSNTVFNLGNGSVLS